MSHWIFLNDQFSWWGFINAGVPQGLILKLLPFMILINDLLKHLRSNLKLFADDCFLFTIINGQNATKKQVFEDLHKIEGWTFQCKRSFNSDPSKQAYKVFLLVRSKRLYIRQFSLMPNQFKRMKPTALTLKSYIRHIFHVWWTYQINCIWIVKP